SVGIGDPNRWPGLAEEALRVQALRLLLLRLPPRRLPSDKKRRDNRGDDNQTLGPHDCPSIMRFHTSMAEDSLPERGPLIETVNQSAPNFRASSTRSASSGPCSLFQSLGERTRSLPSRPRARRYSTVFCP